MDGNPYDILGVDPDTSEEDIKKKYRALVKQYHPDLHPNDKASAEKMSEINEAYEMIRSGEAARYYSSSSSTPSGSFSKEGTTYYYSHSEPDELFRAFFNSFGRFSRSAFEYDPYMLIEDHIEMGMYSRAAEILNNIPYRGGKWHYYAAIIYHSEGYYDEALEFAEKAVSLEPSNDDYRMLYKKLKAYYERESRSLGAPRRFIAAVTMILALLMILQVISPLINRLTV